MTKTLHSIEKQKARCLQMKRSAKKPKIYQKKKLTLRDEQQQKYAAPLHQRQFR